MHTVPLYFSSHVALVQQLDESLGGGIHSGSLTEVVGPAGMGKTQVCLMLSLAALTDEKQEVPIASLCFACNIAWQSKTLQSMHNFCLHIRGASLTWYKAIWLMSCRLPLTFLLTVSLFDGSIGDLDYPLNIKESKHAGWIIKIIAHSTARLLRAERWHSALNCAFCSLAVFST